NPLVTDKDPGDIDRQDAAAVQHVGDGEDQHAERGHQQRIEPVGQVKAVDQRYAQHAAHHTHQTANSQLLDQAQQQGAGQAAFVRGQCLQQGDREEDGHGVVTAGFDFQRRADPLFQMGSAVVEQGEHGGGIGGADNRAQQNTHQQRQIQQPGGEQAAEPCGDHHPKGGKRQGGPEANPEILDLGAQPAVEQDNGQRQVADGI